MYLPNAIPERIAFIKSLLDGNSIPYFIENEHFANLVGSADGTINFGVMVKRQSSVYAKELLELMHSRGEGESKSIKASIHRKYRKKYTKFYLIMDILGIFIGFIFLAVSIICLTSIFFVKEFFRILVLIFGSTLFIGAGYFIIEAVVKDIKPLLKINKR